MATATPAWTPETPPGTCSEPWPYTYNERLNIQMAALNALWNSARAEWGPLVEAYNDPLLAIGLYERALGFPLTDEFTVAFDDGVGYIRCRAFALGVVALAEREGLDATCVRYAVIGTDGETVE